jgi:chaperone BCS1
MDLFDNQLFAGAFLLMISSGVMFLCRRVPLEVLHWLKRQVMISADVLSDDQVFTWLKIWLDAQPYANKASLLTISTANPASHRQRALAEPGRPRVIFTPAPGTHIFFYKRRLVWLSRERKEANDSSGTFGLWRETLTLRVIGRDQELIRSLIREAMELAIPTDDPRISISISVYGYWQQVGLREPKPVESVILDEGVFESLTEDAERFLSGESFYSQMGIPYRRGYLLWGVPGSGKTSAIVALAGHLRLNLYILNLASKGMSDERLNDLLVNVPDHSIVLLEDIDAVFDGRDSTADAKDARVTFSGLLNALDGAAAKEGRLLFMTTNHIERLDPALIRPGRIDVRLRFDYAIRGQVERLFKRFYPGASSALAAEFAGRVCLRQVSMAEVQQHLLLHRDSAEAALNSWDRGMPAMRAAAGD